MDSSKHSKSGFTVLELITAAGFLVVLTASFYASCRHLRSAEQAYGEEAMALHVVENVVTRCAVEQERVGELVRRIAEAEMRESPLDADPGISHECRIETGHATLTIARGGTRTLATVRIPLSRPHAREAMARENVP